MAGNPRIVTQDVTFVWDGATQRLPRGQVIDVPAASALEDAIGSEHLVPLGAVAAQPAPVTEAPEDGPAAEDAQDTPGTAPQPSARTRRSATQTPADGDAGGGDQM